MLNVYLGRVAAGALAVGMSKVIQVIQAARKLSTCVMLALALAMAGHVPAAMAQVTPQLSIASVSQNEGNTGTTNFDFVVSLSSPAGPAGVSFNIAVGGSSATLGVDYLQPTITSYTIPAGETRTTVRVPVVGDLIQEQNESFGVSVNGLTGAVALVSFASGTILNDDGTPPFLSVAGVSQAEGNSGITNFNFMVSLSAPAGPAGVMFDVNVGVGTATLGSDYNAPSPNRFTVPAGATSFAIPVPVIGDTVNEPTEIFSLSLTNVQGAVALNPFATGEIVNDDAPSTPSISVTAIAVNEGNSGTSIANVPVVLSGPAPAGGVSFTLSFPGGSATAGSDYIAPTVRNYSIPQGMTGTTIPITIIGDTAQEPDENLLIQLDIQSGAQNPLAAANLTILNDDGVPPTLTVGFVAADEGNSGTTNMTFPIRLSAPAGPGGVSFSVFVSSQSATLGSDFNEPLQRNYTIPAGATETTVLVPIIGDTLPETDETFRLELQSVVGAANAFPISGTGTIRNDDGPLPTITIADASVSEGNSGTRNLAFTVTRSAPAPPGGQRINFIVTGVTATATNDFDVPVPGSVTIAAGATTATVNVPVRGDTTPETDETLEVAITTLGSDAPVNVTRNRAVGTIVNDDGPVLTLSVAGVSETEGDSGTKNFNFVVTLSGPAPTGGVAFGFSTGTGTATPGTDFTPVQLFSFNAPTGPNFIPAGATTTTIAVPVIGDTVDEPNETFSVSIGGATNNVQIGQATATGTILNDDGPPTLSIADVSVTEGNAGTTNANVTVQLSKPAITAVRFTIATGPDPRLASFAQAQPGTDYTTVNRVVDIAAGAQSATVIVPVIGDALNELDEGLLVSVSGVTGAIVGRGSAAVTIVNDDIMVISIEDVSVVEGDQGNSSFARVVVNRTPSSQSYSVNMTILPGTAREGVDYRWLPPVSVSFSPGQTAALATVAVVLGDDAVEPDETFFVQLQPGPGHQLGAVSRGTITIQNDDVELIAAPADLPTGQVGVAYTQQITVTGGTAPYRFRLEAGTLPAGLTFREDGTLSGTPTAGGLFPLVVAVEESSPAPTGPTTFLFGYGLIINPATITLPPATLSPAVLGRAYQAVLPAATGGTAPYSYQVTGGALPAGISLDRATGAVSGTPTATGVFSFTVTATDSSTGTGPYRTTQTYTVEVNPEPPVASNSALTVPYNAAPVAVPLVLSGGAASRVAVVTAPANGSAVVNGSTITYQPRSGFSGTDSFTYTASNAGGTSAPATVTVTVQAPVFTVTAVGEPTATAGVPYSLTFEFGGGTAPFTNYQVTGLPAGVSITATTANTVTVSGTPTAVGSFTLEASARDSSTGDGPFTVTGTTSLAVAPPVLVLQPGTAALTASYASAFSQAFTASGGSGSFSYAQTGTLPPGLTFNATTGTLSGTPTASGSFSFTITATDRVVTGAGAPFRVARTYTLAVAAPVITVTPTTLPGATAGTAYNVTLVGAGAIGPYTFTLVDGRLPAGITLSSAGVLSGTPTASGSFPLSLRVRDANGETGTVSLTLTVAVPTLTITPATLPEANQGLSYTQTITASGGIAPYSYAVTAGALPEGLTLNGTTGVISGTPVGSGAASFTITVTDSTGGTPARASVAYVLQIAARPDPARDPQVQGLTQSQVQSARRLGDAQIGNFRGRLGWLRPGNGGGGSGGGSGGGAGLASGGGFQNGVRIMAMDPCAPQANSWSVSPCARALGSPGVHGLSGLGGGPFQSSIAAGTVGASGAAGSGAAAADGPPPATGGTGVERPWSVWASGTIRYGDVDPQTGVAAQSFEADGLTLGADYRYSDRLAVGVGLGFGNDIVDVGTNGSRSRTQAVTAATYGSYLLGGGYFADWVVGYQWLDMDLRRFVTSTGGLVRSTRSGSQLFVSVSAGSDIDAGNWRISPYGRFDIVRGSLDAYRENSGSLFDLSYGGQSLDKAAVGVGSTFRYIHAFDGGQILPQLSVEYLYDLDRQEAARVGYVERSNGAFSTITLTGIDREQLSVGLGFEVQWDTGSTVGIDYLTRFSSGIGSDETWQLNARFQF